METNYSYSPQQDLLQDELLMQPVEYAGFWLRFAAYVLDVAIIYGAAFAISITLSTDSPNMSAGMEEFLFLALFIGVILYFPLMESSKYQATLGKRAVGIKVTSLSGNRISFGNALGRLVSKILSAIIFYIGFMMAGFTEKKQGLHDMIAGTLVVKA